VQKVEGQLIITLAAFSGVGKITTAVHLAAFLQNYGETVLIDCDSNRSALIWLIFLRLLGRMLLVDNQAYNCF
jgi:cellulose biosynthesis protein BcsQ